MFTSPSSSTQCCIAALFCLFFSVESAAAPNDDFVITVDMAFPNDFQIPTIGDGYNYNVDCDNDGVNEVVGATGNFTCHYSSAGIYTIRIKDNTGVGTGFPRIYFRGSSTLNSDRLRSVLQWGNGKWASMDGAFEECKNLQVEATDTPDLTLVTNMSSMFKGASNVDFPIASWDVSSVADMSKMFSGAQVFNHPLGLWDTSSVRDMSYMFEGAENFNQNLSGWDTSQVTNMAGMFSAAESFNQAIGDWETSQVTNMSRMFAGAVMFDQAIADWDTSNVTNMAYMFLHATAFDQQIGGWDTGQVEDMSGMFFGTLNFNNDIGQWNTANVVNMSYMFADATMFNQNLQNWDTSNTVDMSHMFSSSPHGISRSMFNGEIGAWNTAKVEDMSRMFSGARSFNKDIGNWNTESVKDMSAMFLFAESFNQDISRWNTSAVISMSAMFSNAVQFNRPLQNWNTSNVISMSNMFDGATEFNQPLGQWNTEKVVLMDYMFANARSFNQPISSWDTSKVIDMRLMFANAASFNQAIGNWDTSALQYARFMFKDAISFNQSLDDWNTSAIRDMAGMFYGASSFNQAIGSWDTAAVRSMHAMFEGASAFNRPINSWSLGNVEYLSSMFKNASSFNQDLSEWNTLRVVSTMYMFYGASDFNQNLADWNVSQLSIAIGMFDQTNLSTVNYDAILNSWAYKITNVQGSLGANNTAYCASEEARNYLINNKSWAIADGGLNCTVINARCGSSNGGTFIEAPTQNLCTRGRTGRVTGSGPWHWQCFGDNGGIDVSCSANMQTYTISAAANPVIGGSADCTPNPVNHGSNSSCAASPNGGYVFVGFSGDCNGSACNLTNVTANKSVTANFHEQTGNVFYHPITPCRLADTRFDSRGGAFGQQTIREFNAVPEAADLSSFGGKATGCGIPPWAVAVHANFTAVGPAVSGYLRAWPWGQGEPNATLFAWPPTFGATNAATVPICQGDSCDYDVNVKIYSSQPIDLVIDAVGYYSQ